MELLGPLLFSGKADFSVQELDFLLVAQGCSLDVKREKKNLTYIFFLKMVNSTETFTRD